MKRTIAVESAHGSPHRRLREEIAKVQADLAAARAQAQRVSELEAGSKTVQVALQPSSPNRKERDDLEKLQAELTAARIQARRVGELEVALKVLLNELEPQFIADRPFGSTLPAVKSAKEQDRERFRRWTIALVILFPLTVLTGAAAIYFFWYIFYGLVLVAGWLGSL